MQANSPVMAWTSAPAKMSDRELTTGRHKVWTRILRSPATEDASFQTVYTGMFNFKKTFWKRQKHGSVFVRTFAGCVQQGGLKRDHVHVVQVFIDGHLDCKSSIGVHIGKGQQVCGPHKEVSMEGVDGKTCGGTEWKKVVNL